MKKINEFEQTSANLAQQNVKKTVPRPTRRSAARPAARAPFLQDVLSEMSRTVARNLLLAMSLFELNSIYLIMIIPAVFMMNSGLFCKYYSILFFLVYYFSYKIVNEKAK